MVPATALQSGHSFFLCSGHFYGHYVPEFFLLFGAEDEKISEPEVLEKKIEFNKGRVDPLSKQTGNLGPEAPGEENILCRDSCYV